MLTMNPLPISHSTTSHPRRRRQGPLDNTWQSLPPAATVILTIVIYHHRNPTNNGIRPASPPFSSPPVAVSPSPPSLSPMAPSWTGMRRRCPPIRHSECRSRLHPPCRKTGQLRQHRQRRRHSRQDASVSSPAAGIGPSFPSWAAAAGRATATSAC